MANKPLSVVTRYLRDLRAIQVLHETPDAMLLERFALQHEEAAFAVLVRRHGPMVLNVSRRVLPSPEDAEDVFQATFLLLARKAASIRKPGSVGSWLHGVAQRLALKAHFLFSVFLTAACPFLVPGQAPWLRPSSGDFYGPEQNKVMPMWFAKLENIMRAAPTFARRSADVARRGSKVIVAAASRPRENVGVYDVHAGRISTADNDDDFLSVGCRAEQLMQ
jgi:Sigma-70 region 2